MTIAFSWNAMLWDAQGREMRGRGGGASLGKRPLYKREEHGQEGRLSWSHTLTLPRRKEGYPIQQWLLLFLSPGGLTCCW